ncbi:cupin domain-containing protein [Primorskyibacter sp. S87]|uniref:cupin domain-containing protein n=1 Tax=Primorskyibacter sp. S87 TaxID=3415126 RepID=UPI003C7BD5BE
MSHETTDPSAFEKPEIRNLKSTALESAEGLEVIVSQVVLPPNVTLPLHWHPGEEIAYILQGSVTLILQGEPEQEYSVGEVGIVPLKKEHTARSGKDGATILVFRVHEEGEPGRTLVD